MIKNTLIPIIDKNLTNNFTALQKKIMLYVDKNSDVLYSFDLSSRISFGDTDRGVVYEACALIESLVENEIKNSKDFYNDNKVKSNPFYATCILAMSSLINHGKKEQARIIMYYMSLMMYTSAHYGFVKFGANKNIMDYTISHLDNSFKIRQVKSLYDFLVDNANTCFDTYLTKIKNASDADIGYVSDALHFRIKSKLKKIFNAYYDNHKSGNYLNYDSDSHTEDDYHIADNNSYTINNLSNKVYLKLLNHQFDSRLLKYCITRSDTSHDKVKKIIDDIISDDDGQIQKVTSAMIEYYMLTSQNKIDTIYKGDFVSYMIQAYASNTDVKQLSDIKSIIDTWLIDNMFKYGKTRYGKTAMSSYKKSIYLFFVYLINFEAKI